MKSKKTKNFLQSKEWKVLREAALFRDGHCFLCESKEKLCVHHILYRKFYKELSLELCNLVTVCPKCHFAIHKGIGNLLLAQKLLQDRPLQWEWIMNHIKKAPVEMTSA